MSEAEYIIEPGLQASAPRKVHVRGALVAMVTAAAVLVALTFILATASLFEAVRLIWLGRTGTTTTATVTALYYSDHRELAFDDSRDREISAFEYRFTTDAGRVIVAKTPVELSRSMIAQRLMAAPNVPANPKATGPPVPAVLKYVPGALVSVRYATFAGHVFSRPWEKPPLGHTIFLLLSCAALLTIATTIAVNLYRRVSTAFHLVRHGLVSVGVIRAKNAVSEDTMRYYVTFVERPPNRPGLTGGAATEWTRPCSSQQFLNFTLEQHVTLIAPPGKPEETTLYRLLPFGR